MHFCLEKLTHVHYKYLISRVFIKFSFTNYLTTIPLCIIFSKSMDLNRLKTVTLYKGIILVLSGGINPFVLNSLFLYPLETSENPKRFWCFRGVVKGCIRNKWVNATCCIVKADLIFKFYFSVGCIFLAE